MNLVYICHIIICRSKIYSTTPNRVLDPEVKVICLELNHSCQSFASKFLEAQDPVMDLVDIWHAGTCRSEDFLFPTPNSCPWPRSKSRSFSYDI